MMRREARGWRPSSCWKHPVQGKVGVCASCLRDRLLALASEAKSSFHNTTSSTSCYISNNALAAAAAEAGGRRGIDVGSVGTIHNLIQADRGQCKSRSSSNKERAAQSSDIGLGRSVSWSQSKATGRLYGLASVTPPPPHSNRGKDRMRRPLSAVPLRNLAAHLGADAVSKTEAKKSSSLLSSLLHLRSGRRKASSSLKNNPKASKNRTEEGQLGNEGAFTTQHLENGIFGKSVRNGWEAGDRDGLYRFDFFKHHGKDLPFKSQLDHRRGSAWKPWATPLRIFNTKSRKKKEHDDASEISSEYNQRHSPATYSAFYRDHGSLSLYSSPMPGGRSRGRTPCQDDRSEMFRLSPYAGSSKSWNFYLTPVRPIKSTSNQRL